MRGVEAYRRPEELSVGLYIGRAAVGDEHLVRDPRRAAERPHDIAADGDSHVCDLVDASHSALVDHVQSTTDFSLAIFRTQLFNAGDMDNVVKVESGYKVEPLSALLKPPAPAAKAGIYGNDAAEAMYPLAKSAADGSALDGAKHRYMVTFAKDLYPPVHAFWSITMYDGKTQRLIKNPIDRYLINSPMLPGMNKNPDGSLTL